MNDALVIRSPAAADAPAMSAVLSASIRELCGADHGDDPAALAGWLENKTPESVAGWIAAGRARLLLAERRGAAVGVGGWLPEGRIVLLYVAPAARFAGVSAALLARMERDIAAAGLAEARLESTATALRFYRARGWRRDGPPVAGRGGAAHPLLKTLAAGPASAPSGRAAG